MLNWVQVGGSLGCRLLRVPSALSHDRTVCLESSQLPFFISAQTRQSFSMNYICGQCYLSERTSPEWPQRVLGKRRQMPGSLVTRLFKKGRRLALASQCSWAAELSKGVSAFSSTWWRVAARLLASGCYHLLCVSMSFSQIKYLPGI